MTNTNDFRRYSYANDPTYLISQFDFQRNRNSQAAPKLRPETQRNFRVHENVKVKTKPQLLAEQKASAKTVAKIAVVAVICLAMVGLVINSFVVKNELTKEISAKQTDIANAQSEYVSLESQLDSLVSISMIDEYAVSKLGMTKIKSNQIQYMDVNEYKTQRIDNIQNQTPDELQVINEKN